MATVSRIHHEIGSQGELTTLEQQFRFEGADTTAAAISNVLRTAPLVGETSIFGPRPGQAHSDTGSSRHLSGFSPAPGFRFDVELTELDDGEFLVRFSQHDRAVPYLEGDLLWIVTDLDGSVLFDEQINTDRALQIVLKPLTGPSPSLRRWLFFRMGHQRVMAQATDNIAALLSG